MTYCTNIFFNSSWNALKFCAPALILPLPFRDTLICHALYTLTYKVQERAFTYFFPDISDPLLPPPSLVDPSKFEMLNSCLATSVSFLILNQTGRTVLARTMLIYRLYIIAVLSAGFVLLVSSVVILLIAQRIRLYLYPIDIPQIRRTEENLLKAEQIKTFLEKINIINPRFDEQNIAEEKNAHLIDKVSLSLPSLPIREKDNPLHIWDVVETIDLLVAHAIDKVEAPKCPNGCDIKLELEDAVATDLQDEIIKLLEEALRKEYFSLLPFNEV